MFRSRRTLAATSAAAFLTIGLAGPLPASAAPSDAECIAAQNTFSGNFGSSADVTLLADLEVALAAAVEAQAEIDGLLDVIPGIQDS